MSTIKFQAAYSSDYKRAIQTIEPLVNIKQLPLTLVEDLRERNIGNFEPYTFQEAKRKVYEDLTFSFPQGESSIKAQQRACNVIIELLRKHRGETILIGTHGDIFTLMLNYFDKQYHYSFWQSTTMPDIYKVQFKNDVIIGVERCWE